MNMWLGPIPQSWDDKTITDKRYRKALFDKAYGECQRCGEPLVFERSGSRFRGKKGCWEIHHHPERKAMQKTFRGIINPHIPLFVRVLCIECHDETRSNPDKPLIVDCRW